MSPCTRACGCSQSRAGTARWERPTTSRKRLSTSTQRCRRQASRTLPLTQTTSRNNVGASDPGLPRDVCKTLALARSAGILTELYWVTATVPTITMRSRCSCRMGIFDMQSIGRLKNILVNHRYCSARPYSQAHSGEFRLVTDRQTDAESPIARWQSVSRCIARYGQWHGSGLAELLTLHARGHGHAAGQLSGRCRGEVGAAVIYTARKGWTRTRPRGGGSQKITVHVPAVGVFCGSAALAGGQLFFWTTLFLERTAGGHGLERTDKQQDINHGAQITDRLQKATSKPELTKADQLTRATARHPAPP